MSGELMTLRRFHRLGVWNLLCTFHRVPFEVEVLTVMIPSQSVVKRGCQKYLGVKLTESF